MNEKEAKRIQYDEIPISITPEGERLFQQIFGFTYESAVEVAKTEGEVGNRMRLLFSFLKGETYDINKQESESEGTTE